MNLDIFNKLLSIEEINNRIKGLEKSKNSINLSIETYKKILKLKTNTYLPIAVTNPENKTYPDCAEVCEMSRECANHTTAGDFRYDGGMTPDIVRVENEWLCTKQDTNVYQGAYILDGK